jgi:cellulose synthase/poly-beta-1,6-N-acetylglucosamine synthase-like glycosyltransferase
MVSPVSLPESSMCTLLRLYGDCIVNLASSNSSAISFCVTNGEVSPFIGHNAFLRWSAVQDAAFVDPDDGITKQWNESCVSEDFDLSLRIQMRGWTMRWASYSNGGFQEGVSLTAVDELNRWQKCKLLGLYQSQMSLITFTLHQMPTAAVKCCSTRSQNGFQEAQSTSFSDCSSGPPFRFTRRFPP